MKHLVYIGFGIMALGLSYHLYTANTERMALVRQFNELSNSYEDLEKDNQKIEDDLDYLSDPHNLEKELRARYNYRAPNEKMIIVVPEGSEN